MEITWKMEIESVWIWILGFEFGPRTLQNSDS